MRSDYRSEKLTPKSLKGISSHDSTNRNLSPRYTPNPQTIRRTTTKPQATTDIPGDVIIIERSLNDFKLRTPISIKLENVLKAQEIGLVEYIIKSYLSYQPGIIPYIFENKSLVKVAPMRTFRV